MKKELIVAIMAPDPFAIAVLFYHGKNADGGESWGWSMSHAKRFATTSEALRESRVDSVPDNAIRKELSLWGVFNTAHYRTIDSVRKYLLSELSTTENGEARMEVDKPKV